MSKPKIGNYELEDFLPFFDTNEDYSKLLELIDKQMEELFQLEYENFIPKTLQNLQRETFPFTLVQPVVCIHWQNIVNSRENGLNLKQSFAI